MSCIPKILELKGDKEFLIVPTRSIAIEGGGHYRGYDYLITFQDMGFRCGYVALPPNHPVNKSETEYLSDIELEVHGGVTFFAENHLSSQFFGNEACLDKWVGFDAGHAWDISDLECAKKYFPDLRSIQMEHIENRSMNDRWGDGSHCELRTKEYMEQECKDLIDQLIEKEVA